MYSPLFRHVLFPAYESLLRRRPTHRYIREYERNQRLSPAQLQQLQRRKLTAMLQHCWQAIPFYRQSWEAAGISSDDLAASDILPRLPVLTKSLIRANLEALQAEHFPGGKVEKATGGSTGSPLTFAHDRDSYYRRTAVMWRGYRWTGLQRGERTLYLWGTALGNQSQQAALKENLHNRLFNRRIYSCFGMSDDDLADYARRYNRYRPKYVVGYVSALRDFARYLASQPGPHWRPSSILSGAEPLYQADRDLIEAGFQAPVYNTYGCREFMLIASECEQRNGLHINTDQLVVETIDADGQPITGQRGRLVITDLHNRGMPFIRYELGDDSIIEQRSCPCGRPFPLLARIEGRQLDTLTTPTGKSVPGEFFPHLIKEVAAVRQYQVVQDEPDHLTINLVVDPSYGGADDEFLRAEIETVFGAQMRLTIDQVEQIDQTISGKRRVTINRVAEND